MTRLDLAGTWRLSSADGEIQALMPIPGDVHTALKNAGFVPDPYVGRNEIDLQWVAEQDWEIEQVFTLPSTEGSWYLDITDLDTVATVTLNSVVVLEADNCFRRFRPDVGSALREGENRMSIRFHSSIREGAARQAKQPFYIPYQTANSPIANGNMLRKPQCHFGWDWNIALAPLGLYGTIALRKLETARVEHVTITQSHGESGVDVAVTVSLFADAVGGLPLILTLGDEEVRLDVGVRPGEVSVHHIFHIDAPRLWWPSGSGEQALYTLVVETPSETVTRRIGLRKAELLTDPDDAGSRFAFRINGSEIFCRGANWIPADALFSLTSPDKTRDLLQSAIDANMNMIRIWGGGFYEADWFYDLCDEMGLMVWQDFQFSCNLYPSTPDFLANVTAEVDYQVRRLITHPSIILWCGDNELVGALTWFKESVDNRDRYLVSYDRLNRTIEQTLLKAAPDALWWPSSPATGYMDYGDAWHADGSGDMHYWSVWHENKPFEDYRSVRPRFCSEFGFQSYTSLPVIRTYAGDSDLNIASPVMELHQKNVGGNERIAATMFRYFRFPEGFANFVYLSQVQQALAIRTAVDYWRSLKPHCMGTLYWQLNDTWPVASWSSLDYGGGWKLLHYLARRFFQPVAVAAIPSQDGTRIDLSLVNDTPSDVTVTLNLSLLALNGEKRPLRSLDVTCSPDAAIVAATVNTADIPADCLLSWNFTASNGMGGDGHHVVGTYKALDLQPAGLALDVRPAPTGGYDVTVQAGGLGLYIMVESTVAGRFSDNGFDLSAGESRRITFLPSSESEGEPVFRIYDLQSCASAG